MADETGSPSAAGKHYQMGNVGPGARVAQGENISWVEGLASRPGGEELSKQLDALLARIEQASDLSPIERELVATKTRLVAESLAQAQSSPGGLHAALLDAQSYLDSKASWAWDGLRAALCTDAAQQIISSISEAATRAGLRGLLGAS